CRGGVATGRLPDQGNRPRRLFPRITGAGPDGRRRPEQLVRDLDRGGLEVLEAAVIPALRQVPLHTRPLVYFDNHTESRRPFYVRKAMAGKHVMLIGVTGF